MHVTTSKLDSLTSLRFFAAFGVFLLHYSQISGALSLPEFKSINNILAEGHVWVTFFFMLSGFILTYSIYSKNKKPKFTEFMFRRIARIFPVHFLTLLVTIMFFLFIGKSIVLSSLISNLFLVQSWNTSQSVYWDLNAVSWSLSDELFFYVIFIPLCRVGLNWIISLMILILAVFFFVYINYKNVSYDFIRWFFYVLPIIRLMGFIVGILCYHIYEKIKSKNFDNYYSLFEFTSVIILFTSIYISAHSNINKPIKWDIYYIIPLALLIIAFSLQKGIFSKALGNKYILFLGNSSFALYMIHYYAIAIIFQYFIKNHNLHVIIFYLPFVAFLIILLSCIVYFYFEKPMNTYIFNKLMGLKFKKKFAIID